MRSEHAPLRGRRIPPGRHARGNPSTTAPRTRAGPRDTPSVVDRRQSALMSAIGRWKSSAKAGRQGDLLARPGVVPGQRDERERGRHRRRWRRGGGRGTSGRGSATASRGAPQPPCPPGSSGGRGNASALAQRSSTRALSAVSAIDSSGAGTTRLRSPRWGPGSRRPCACARRRRDRPTSRHAPEQGVEEGRAEGVHVGGGPTRSRRACSRGHVQGRAVDAAEPVAVGPWRSALPQSSSSTSP